MRRKRKYPRRGQARISYNCKEILTVKIVVSLMFLAGSCSILAMTWFGAGIGYL